MTDNDANYILRRWHPAWIWLAIRYFEPRELWRPSVWYAIVWAYWRVGRS